MIAISLEPTANRKCGGCQLCCRLLPVPPIDKAANKKCCHQSYARGCKIYGEHPFACQIFSCQWLTNSETYRLNRPDRSGYVIDPMPEYIRLRESNGAEHRISVIQIWCDPRRPNAHRDPNLRNYLEAKAQEGFAALIRYSPIDGFVLCAPSMTSDNQWHEQSGTHEPEHTVHEIFSSL